MRHDPKYPRPLAGPVQNAPDGLAVQSWTVAPTEHGTRSIGPLHLGLMAGQAIFTSGRLEYLPFNPQLTNGSTQGAQLEIFSSPVRQHRRSSSRRVEPLAMGSAFSSRQFLAAEALQLPGGFPVLHGRVTTPSNQIGASMVSCRRFGGNGFFKSSYVSITASRASLTLLTASSRVSPSVTSSAATSLAAASAQRFQAHLSGGLNLLRCELFLPVARCCS